MDIPIQHLRLNFDPPVPEPGGTHVLGTNGNMRNSSGLADKWARHLGNREGVRREPLETIDNEVTDNLGSFHLSFPAAAPGRRSSHTSGYNHVDDREPGSEHTYTSTSSFLNPDTPYLYLLKREHTLQALHEDDVVLMGDIYKHLSRDHCRPYARQVDALASVLVKIIEHHQRHPAVSSASPRQASKYVGPAHGLGYDRTGSSYHLTYRRVTTDGNIRDQGGWNDMSAAARWGDTNILPFLHTILVVVKTCLIQQLTAIFYLEKLYPWKLASFMLNFFLVPCEPKSQVQNHSPLSKNDQLPCSLPEDFAMRGMLYTEDYFPNNWFENDKIDEDEKYFELASCRHLTESLPYESPYLYQRPCFMPLVSHKERISYANTVPQRWEGNHAPVQPSPT